MNFSKLKLNENAAGVAITSNNAATRNAATSGANASGPGQSGQTQGTVNSQAGQAAGRVGKAAGGQGTNSMVKKMSPTRADTQVNAGGPTNIQSSYDATLSRVELVKMRESAKCDWRQELMEAANPNDDPNHPFVEVMPYNDYRMKEAKKLMAQAAAKDKAQGQLTQGMQEAAPLVAAAGKAILGAAKGAAIKGAKNMAKKATEPPEKKEVPTYEAG